MSITAIDFYILIWIQEHLRCAALDWFFPAVSQLGNGGTVWIVIAVVFLFFRKTRRFGICMLVCLAVNAILGEKIIKPLVCRERPCTLRPIADMLIARPSSYSFPSGHSASSFTAATALFLNHRRFGIAAYILAACIAFSRLYCYVHFPTDVLCGILLGVCVAYAVTTLLKKRLFHTFVIH